MGDSPCAVVVGGGIVGVCIGYYLATAGVRVTVVERGDLAAGTSGRCDGNVMVQTKESGLIAEMTKASIGLYEQLARECEDFHWTQRGSLLLVETEQEWALARQRVAWQQGEGLPVRLVGADELAKMEPELARDMAGAVECSMDGALYPLAAVHAIGRAAAEAGARLLPHTEVRGIAVGADGRVEGVDTAEGRLAADYVVVAAGVWTPSLLQPLGVDVPIRPMQGVLLVTEPLPRPLIHRKVMDARYIWNRFRITGAGAEEGASGQDATISGADAALEELYRTFGIGFVGEPMPRGNLMIGSSRRASGFDLSYPVELARAMLSRAARFVPRLSEARILRIFAGLRPNTPDNMPIIGPVERIPGLYIAAGHDGEGIGLAPATGALVASMISGTRVADAITDLDAAALQLRRFDLEEGR